MISWLNVGAHADEPGNPSLSSARQQRIKPTSGVSPVTHVLGFVDGNRE